MLSKQDIENLEAQHGKDIVHCKGPVRDESGEPAWEVVLKKPQRKHYKVFRAMVNNPTQKADACEILVRQMVVHPPVEAFDSLLNDHFGICESSAVQKAILYLCDMESDESGK
jgi:hypothetical protein